MGVGGGGGSKWREKLKGRNFAVVVLMCLVPDAANAGFCGG
jgi:hypothetical protein